MEENGSFQDSQCDPIGELHGYGGALYKIGLLIPNKAKSYLDFIEKAKNTETRFIKTISDFPNV